MLESIRLEVLEQRNANGGAHLRKMIDEEFTCLGGWEIAKSGDVDWRRCHQVNGTKVCIGVEIQVSARSDLLVRDVIHLRRALENGSIDIGVIVVPSVMLEIRLQAKR